MDTTTENVTTCPVRKREPQRYYEPLYGTLANQIDTGSGTGVNSQDGNLVLTEPDGTIYLFGRPDNGIGPFATGAWEETISANGDISKVTGWYDSHGNPDPSTGPPYTQYQPGYLMAGIENILPGAAHPYEEDIYIYYTDASGAHPANTAGNIGLCTSITHLNWDATVGGLVYASQDQYAYYDGTTNPTYGLPSDLESITTVYAGGTLEYVAGQTPLSTFWTGGDSYYYRYYVHQTPGDGATGPHAHGGAHAPSGRCRRRPGAG